jgi:hypothetical protein
MKGVPSSAEALAFAGAKAEALAAISRRTVRKGRKQGRDWCGGMEEAGAVRFW